MLSSIASIMGPGQLCTAVRGAPGAIDIGSVPGPYMQPRGAAGWRDAEHKKLRA
eukprot:SAG31_NODE_3115_length_4659_cov_2.837939_8_plen_54_part_00